MTHCQVLLRVCRGVDLDTVALGSSPPPHQVHFLGRDPTPTTDRYMGKGSKLQKDIICLVVGGINETLVEIFNQSLSYG